MKKVVVIASLLFALLWQALPAKAQSNWTIGVQVARNDLVDQLPEFGTHSSASDGYDVWYDIPAPPPSAGNYVRMVSYHPEWAAPAGSAFSQVMHAPLGVDDSLSWSFVIEATGTGPLSLTFSGADTLPSELWGKIIVGSDTLDIRDSGPLNLSDATPVNAEVLVSNANRAPLPFSLLAPNHADTVYSELGEAALLWGQSFDPDDDPLTYEVTYGENPDLLGATTITVSDTSAIIASLTDDVVYYWSVAAVDAASGYQTPADTFSFYNYVIDSPSAFSMLAPASGTMLHADSAQVLWQSTTDSDPGDSLRYFLEWSTSMDFTTVDDITIADTSFWIHNLTQEEQVYWRVSAIDSFNDTTQANEYSSGFHFFYRAPTAPLPFNMLAPANGSTIVVDSVQVVWTAAETQNLDDMVSYRVEASYFPDFSFSEDTLVTDTSHWVRDLPDDSTLYWRVTASNNYGQETQADDWAAGWSATISLPDPPHPFSLLSPVDQTEIPSTGDFPIIFRWELGGDPDPEDAVSYTLEMSTDASFTEPTLIDAGEADSVEVASLTQADHYWRVRARDTDNNEVLSSETWMLVVTLDVDGERKDAMPREYALSSLYPNPFNPTLSAVVDLPAAATLQVAVYNSMGQLVAILASGQYKAGRHSLTFDGSAQASGVYFVRAHVPGKLSVVRRVVLMK